MKTSFHNFLIAFAVCLFASSLAFVKAESVSESWVQRYNGPSNGYDSAEALSIDAAGNVVVTGRSASDLYTAKYRAIDGVKIRSSVITERPEPLGQPLQLMALGMCLSQVLPGIAAEILITIPQNMLAGLVLCFGSRDITALTIVRMFRMASQSMFLTMLS